MHTSGVAVWLRIGRFGLHDTAHLPTHIVFFDGRRALPPDSFQHILKRVTLVQSSNSELTLPVDSLCDPRLRLLEQLL